MTTAHDVALLRLVAQGIVRAEDRDPDRITRHMVALQAQDLWSGLASLRARSSGPESASSPVSTESALADGVVVRTWALRGTLHLVAASDVRWILALLAPRALASAAKREADVGLTAAHIDRAERIALDLLYERGPTPRPELIRAWEQGGIDVGGHRSYHLLWHLAVVGLIALGPLRDGRQLIVLLDQWVEVSAVPERQELLGELARRYFESHGPATPGDLRRWANLTAVETRTAIDLARDELSVIEQDGTELLLGPTTRDELAASRREARGVFVLPGFDELIFGYQDRSATLPAERAGWVLRPNGIGRNTVVFDGRVVATWKWSAKAGEVEVHDLAPFPPRLRNVAVRRAAILAGGPGRTDHAGDG